MKIYNLQYEQLLPGKLEHIWKFFTDPRNLKIITPENLNFKFIRGASDGQIYPGKLIEYRVHPWPGFPLQWVTEITQVKEGEYFIDEQRFGPYKFWHHQHFFKTVGDSVQIRDQIHFALPGGFLSPVIYKLIVQKQLEEIFTYRQQQLNLIDFTQVDAGKKL